MMWERNRAETERRLEQFLRIALPALLLAAGVAYAWRLSQARQAISCVLPNCGVAIVLPRNCAGSFSPDSGCTTSAAPPAAAAATILISSPFDFV